MIRECINHSDIVVDYLWKHISSIIFMTQGHFILCSRSYVFDMPNCDLKCKNGNGAARLQNLSGNKTDIAKNHNVSSTHTFTKKHNMNA